MTTRNLSRLLAPRSVAVVGASVRHGAVGTTLWQNLAGGGYRGELWPVNPKYDAIGAVRCHGSPERLPHAPDLAVLCTPPHTLPDLVRRLGALGTRAVVVTTALRRTGREDAAAITVRMLQAAQPHTLRILGPHCAGVLIPGLGLNASLAPRRAPPGRLAFVSQSGALMTAVLDWAGSREIGFSHCVSLGETADVDFGDLIDYLASDEQTGAILLYMESVGSPRKFMSAARAAARNKPVVVVKAGRGEQGARAAASRTGEPPGSDAVYDAAIRRAGMLRVDTTEDLFAAVEMLANARPLNGEGLAVITNGGGPGVMAADALGAAGLPGAQPGADTLRALDALLWPGWSRANPVDVGPDAGAPRYAGAAEALLVDPALDALLVIHAPSAAIPSAPIAQSLLPVIAQTRRNVLACFMGGDSVGPARELLEAHGVPQYDTPEQAVRAFAQLVQYRRNQRLLMEVPALLQPEGEGGAAAATAVVRGTLAQGRTALSPAEAAAVLRAYGIPTVRTRAMAGAHELFVGAALDPTFGPVVLFGQGGAAAGPTDERAVALPPLNQVLARDLVSRASVARLLRGHRGRRAADEGAIHRVLIAVGQMLADIPEVVALQLDPLLADEHGTLALDARIELAASAGAGVQRFAILPYPRHLEQSVPWRGGDLVVRPIRPEDAPAHLEFFDALDPGDVRARVMGSVSRLRPSDLARLTQIDYDREMALIATRRREDGGWETLGVARSYAMPDRSSAEFAVVVRSDLKGKGLGGILMARLIAHCRESGIGELRGETMPENAKMLKMARLLGFSLTTDRDAGLVRMSRSLRGS